jgi:hypothetical protein
MNTKSVTASTLTDSANTLMDIRNHSSTVIISILCIGIITVIFFTNFNLREIKFSKKDFALLILLLAFLFYINGYEKIFLLCGLLFIFFYFVPSEKLNSFYTKNITPKLKNFPFLSKLGTIENFDKNQDKKHDVKQNKKINNDLDNDDDDDDDDDSDSSNGVDEITIDDPVTNTTIPEESNDNNIDMKIEKKDKDNDQQEFNVDILLSQLQNDYLQNNNVN